MARLILFITFLFVSSGLTGQVLNDSAFVRKHYEKHEYRIPMRDGVRLHTIVYVPRDKSQQYPVMLMRTPYSIGPYGDGAYKKALGPSSHMMRDLYIFAYQDVRGRYMSEGTYDNMRPHMPDKKKKTDIDESSDTWDTIDWLIKNIKNNNGKVGQWGISYPGFYTIAGAVEAHPALKASSPQAPISDFFFDDFHHHGAYLQSYWIATLVFGYQKDSLTTKPWYRDKMMQTGPDGYQFYMDMGPLKNASKYYGEDNEFWQQLVEHPNYDEFWQKRSILPHLNNIDHPIMTVGGWFDAEDLYGPLNIYKTVEKKNDNFNMIVMGPWSHGDWSREKGIQAVGNIYFGDSISTFYQKNIEKPFFEYFLKEGMKPDLPEAYMFDTGRKEWTKFDQWPPDHLPKVKLYFGEDEQLSINKPTEKDGEFSYISDPDKPVPYTEDIKVVFTPRKFMTDDQRFASKRPDVITFQTEVLEDDLTLAGEIMAKLKVSTTGTDADWVVKLIDVYPPDHPDYSHNPSHIRMGGYQQLVRSEVFRGRFRNSYANPEPFVPGEITEVDIPLQDILHTFKKGHRIMIQIHSTWFPYIDRNPQKYVDNIFKADEEDFQKAMMTVYGSSVISIGGEQQEVKVDMLR